MLTEAIAIEPFWLQNSPGTSVLSVISRALSQLLHHSSLWQRINRFVALDFLNPGSLCEPQLIILGFCIDHHFTFYTKILYLLQRPFKAWEPCFLPGYGGHLLTLSSLPDACCHSGFWNSAISEFSPFCFSPPVGTLHTPWKRYLLSTLIVLENAWALGHHTLPSQTLPSSELVPVLAQLCGFVSGPVTTVSPWTALLWVHSYTMTIRPT